MSADLAALGDEAQYTAPAKYSSSRPLEHQSHRFVKKPGPSLVTLGDEHASVKRSPSRDDPLGTVPIGDLDRAERGRGGLVECSAVQRQLRVRESNEPVLDGFGYRRQMSAGPPQPAHRHTRSRYTRAPRKPPRRPSRRPVLARIEIAHVRLLSRGRRPVQLAKQPCGVGQRLELAAVQLRSIPAAQTLVHVHPCGTSRHKGSLAWPRTVTAPEVRPRRGDVTRSRPASYHRLSARAGDRIRRRVPAPPTSVHRTASSTVAVSACVGSGAGTMPSVRANSTPAEKHSVCGLATASPVRELRTCALVKTAR